MHHRVERQVFLFRKKLTEKSLGDGYLVLKLINILTSEVVKI